MYSPISLTEEAKSVLNFLAGFPEGNATLDNKDLKSLLLYTGGNMLARGTLYNIKSKSLGAGAYRVTLEHEK